MPKIAKELSAIEVRNLKKPGFFAVGGVSGLQIQVSDSGSKSWVLRTRIAGKRRHIGLGPYPEVSLKRAREQASEIKDQIRNGVDPLQERKEARQKLLAAQLRIITFREVAKQYIEKKSKEFKPTSREKQIQRLENSLINYAYPKLGSLSIADIELAHIIEVLKPIWETKNPTADRLRQNLERIIDLATVQGYRSGANPAKWSGYLSEILPAPSKVINRQHMKALPVDDLPAFMERLKGIEGVGARALEFAILTCSRSAEVRGASWGEVDFKNNLWIIPASRMKANRQHTVPLCARASEILEYIPRFAGSDFLFPSYGGKRLSENGMTVVLKRMGVDVTQHGFRSTFKDWARLHTSYADEVSELALAHVSDDKTRAAYARDELLDKRRLLMADWEKYCYTGEKPERVVSLSSVSKKA